MPIPDFETDRPPPADPPHRDDRDGGYWQAPFDPYYLFGEATGFRFIRGNKAQAFPVVLELRRPLVEVVHVLDAICGKDLYFDRSYREPLPALRKARFVTALARKGFFALLAKDEHLREIVRAFELCAPTPRLDFMPGEGTESGVDHGRDGRQRAKAQQAQALPFGRLSQDPAPGTAAARVMVGVIDDAIGFANARFRTKSAGNDVTRLHAFWGQDLAGIGVPGPQPSVGPAPSLGVVLDRQWIDVVLAAADSPTGPDEEAVYRAAGLDYLDPGHKSWARRAGHGTAVMDLAAGMNPADVTATSPTIAAVQLPVAITADTSGAQLPSYVIDGVRWILQCATDAGAANGGAPLPCVVNVSYGTRDGPHDGTGKLDAALDEIIALARANGQRLSIVVPSGNGHLARCHGALDIRRLHSGKLRWEVLPDGKTPSFLEIWLPRGTKFGHVAVRVTTPTGYTTPWVEESPGEYAWPSANLPLLWIRHHGPGSQPGNRRVIVLGVYPTARTTESDEIAPPGAYTIEVYNRAPGSIHVDAWIRRNDTPMGYPVRGRQSRFADRDYLEHRFRKDGAIEEEDIVACSVQRYGSLNGFASGRLTVVAAGCRVRDLSMAPYSAAGPTVEPEAGGGTPRRGPDKLDGPDAATYAEHSHARGGLLAAGLRSGSTVAMNGTSVASAQLARVVAANLAAGGGGTRDEVKQLAKAQETARAQEIEPYGPLKRMPHRKERAGAGRIELPPGELPPGNLRR